MKLQIHEEGDHPSRHSLTRFHAGDGDPAERSRIEAHLKDCPACRTTIAAMEECRRDFQANHDRAAFLAGVRLQAAGEVRSGGFWSPWLTVPRMAVVGGAAVLILALALVFSLSPAPDERPQGTRVKGAGFELGYLVMDGERPVVAQSDRVLHPGDRIQFVLSAPSGGYVHIVGVDDAGQVSVYFPLPGQNNDIFPGGSQRAVPGSVVLDATLGRERVFALICDRPLERQAVVDRIRALREDPRAWIDQERLPLDCRQTSLLLVKR